jgi:Ras-related protein Rab-8A
MSEAGRSRKYDHLVKLLLIGDSGVGKSCILLRYCDNEFTTSFITTIGIDFKVKTVTVGDKRLKLQIWDTAGQERFKTICTAYYRGAQGIFLTFDVSDRKSFENVKNWGRQIKDNAQENVVRVLLANKADIPKDEWAISEEEGKQLAASLGDISIVETSAKEGVGVEEAFKIMAQKILEQLEADAVNTQDESDKPVIADLGSSKPAPENKKGCC